MRCVCGVLGQVWYHCASRKAAELQTVSQAEIDACAAGNRGPRMTKVERSMEKITKADLQRLASIARSDREDLFRRNSSLGKLHRNRVLCVALCQGAALHYLDKKNGVRDFDVWTFYHEHHECPFPYRRRMRRDFGHPKFGKSPDSPTFVGRRVDLFGRSIPYERDQTPIEAVRCYLANSRNRSPRLLAKKAVIILEPEDQLGEVLWPIEREEAG